MKKYRFFRKTGDRDDNVSVIRADKFAYGKLCETYDRNGEPEGCSGAGCYSLLNYEGDACIRDLRSAMTEKFGRADWAFEDWAFEGCTAAEKSFAEAWLEENEQHEEGEEYTYWDGHNFKSIIVGGYDGDLEEVDGQEREKLEARLLAAKAGGFEEKETGIFWSLTDPDISYSIWQGNDADYYINEDYEAGIQAGS